MEYNFHGPSALLAVWNRMVIAQVKLQQKPIVHTLFTIISWENKKKTIWPAELKTALYLLLRLFRHFQMHCQFITAPSSLWSSSRALCIRFPLARLCLPSFNPSAHSPSVPRHCRTYYSCQHTRTNGTPFTVPPYQLTNDQISFFWKCTVHYPPRDKAMTTGGQFAPNRLLLLLPPTENTC